MVSNLNRNIFNEQLTQYSYSDGNYVSLICHRGTQKKVRTLDHKLCPDLSAFGQFLGFSLVQLKLKVYHP